MCVERFEWQECNMCGGVGMAGIQCDWKGLGMARMRGGGEVTRMQCLWNFFDGKDAVLLEEIGFLARMQCQ